MSKVQIGDIGGQRKLSGAKYSPKQQTSKSLNTNPKQEK